MSFLPVTKEEMHELGWEQADFVLVSGDAYVDHPSFGHAIISRVLQAHGYKVALLAQPDWKSAEDFRRFGRPALAYLITSGNVDSMVNHYSVFKHRRKKDSYSPCGKPGMRPDRATIVYSSRAREAYRDVPVIIGGLEASLRRLAHYDYWDDKVRRSILLDAKADLLVYAMAENTVVEIAQALEAGLDIKDITWIRGTVYKKSGSADEYADDSTTILPAFEEICEDKRSYAMSFAMQYDNNDAFYGRRMIEPYKDVVVVQNPPAEPLTQEQLDHVYELPYEGRAHPMYELSGRIPAEEEVIFSITANRGCFGSCSFCALSFHQGRIVQGRSKASVLAQARKMTEMKDFKGYIHDVGGPTANFTKAACDKQAQAGACRDRRCLFPQPCNDLKVSHSEYLDILREMRKLPRVKKVFIRSGIRYDYAIYDKDDTFIRELCEHHVSGTLKVAPEHVAPEVLKRMGKPPLEVFLEFTRKYKQINRTLGKKQYLIPYFISSHPGSTLKSAVKLAEYLKREGFLPDQVQDFYPTPGTLSTCMYYTGIDPATMQEVYVPRDTEEKRMQRALLHFHKKENFALVRKALLKAGRPDLIGYGKNCIVKPERKNR